MISNISFAFTYSICNMTKKTVCACTVDSNISGKAGDAAYHPKSCCSSEVKMINNSSDFENINKQITASSPQLLNQTTMIVLPDSDSFKDFNKDVPGLYQKPNDLPVKYSSLLI